MTGSRWIAGLLLLLGAGVAPAAEPDDPAAGVLEVAGPVTGTVFSGRGTIVTIPLRLKPGWHVQANPSTTGYLATELLPVKCGPVKFGGRTYPPGRPFRLAGGDETLSVYEGFFEVRFAVVAPPAVTRNAWQTLDLELRFQPCDATTCYPPRTIPVKARVNVRSPPAARASARR